MSEPFLVHVSQPFQHLERYLSYILLVYKSRPVHILLQVTKRKVFHRDVEIGGIVVVPAEELNKTL